MPTKPLTPIWAGIALTGIPGQGVKLSAYDSEVSAEVLIRSAEGTFAGDPAAQPSDANPYDRAVVSGRLLAAIAKVLPKKQVEFATEGTVVNIRCGTAEFTLPTMIAAEFPKLPPMPDSIGAVDAAEFAAATARVVIAASKDEAVTKLSGVQLQLVPEGVMRMAASDRYRVALLELPWQGALVEEPAAATVLVPWRSLADVGRLGDGNVHIAFDDSGSVFGLAGGDRRVTTRVLDEEFPNVWRIVPPEEKTVTRAAVVVRDVADAVARALTVINDDKQRLHLRFDSDGLHMAGGNAAGFGGWAETVPVDVDGDPMQLWVSPRYLLDGLNALPSDKAHIDLTAYDRPIVLRPDVPGYVHAVMPTKAPSGVSL